MELNASIIVQLAVILTLMLWLSNVLFRPLMRLFDAREARIQGAKAEASALSQQGQDKAHYIEERMRRAQREAREAFSSIKAEGASYQRQVTEKSKAEARVKIATAKIRIQGELDVARLSMKPLVEENASLLVAKLRSPDMLNTHKQGGPKMEFRSA